MQIPALQMPLTQSELTLHCLPAAHFGQFGPPQSTSVSDPFFTPSVQVGDVQTPETQVAPAGQVTPQLPQFLTSDIRFVSQPSAPLLLQLAKPGWQTQLPFAHVPLMHTFPQAPQLFGSLLVLMH
ncbi:hypothetical protein [Deinococcus apachensis]|uniref:hypothetical protein n=1 Tax=Deinococcus apachensis TaxID=309886 RepID=UPI001FE0A90C|nr:hypothetical protein [Deinococcus apachensis]